MKIWDQIFDSKDKVGFEARARLRARRHKWVHPLQIMPGCKRKHSQRLVDPHFEEVSIEGFKKKLDLLSSGKLRSKVTDEI